MSVITKTAAVTEITKRGAALEMLRNEARRLVMVYTERRQLRHLMKAAPEARIDVGLSYRDVKMALNNTRYFS